MDPWANETKGDGDPGILLKAHMVMVQLNVRR